MLFGVFSDLALFGSFGYFLNDSDIFGYFGYFLSDSDIFGYFRPCWQIFGHFTLIPLDFLAVFGGFWWF